MAGHSEVELAIMHGDAAEEAERIYADLKTKIPKGKITVQGQISPALGVHTGPGLLGIGVFRKQENKIMRESTFACIKEYRHDFVFTTVYNEDEMDSSPSVSKRFNLIMIEIKVNCFLNVALIKNAPDLPQGWALNFCGAV